MYPLLVCCVFVVGETTFYVSESIEFRLMSGNITICHILVLVHRTSVTPPHRITVAPPRMTMMAYDFVVWMTFCSSKLVQGTPYS